MKSLLDKALMPIISGKINSQIDPTNDFLEAQTLITTPNVSPPDWIQHFRTKECYC